MDKKQEKIKYRDIMDLGFTEDIQSDSVYYDEFGFDWAIINKKLTKHIYLDWDKATQFCEMVRMDKNQYIQNKMPIKNLDEVKMYIDFFCNDKHGK